jgi:hypothetical protein
MLANAAEVGVGLETDSGKVIVSVAGVVPVGAELADSTDADGDAVSALPSSHAGAAIVGVASDYARDSQSNTIGQVGSANIAIANVL